MRIVRWNLSSRAPEFRRADAFFVSFPKSGRTWARVFLHAYMAAVVDSFKTRRAKVGGFRDYFSADDLHYAPRAMERLDRRSGYEAGDVAASAVQ